MTTSKQDDAGSKPGEVALERPVGRPFPKRLFGPRRYLVADRRNSVSAAPLDSLDWNRWFTDGTSRGLYLHVWSKDGETIHRVFCRHSDTPRLRFDGGTLRWLVDKPLGADWAADMRAKLERPCCGTLKGSRHRATCPDRKTPNARVSGPQQAAQD